MTITLGGLSEMYWYFRLLAKVAFTLDTEARGLLPFYANLVKLYTFTVLRQNALTFTLPPPYMYAAKYDVNASYFCNQAAGHHTPADLRGLFQS